MEKGKTIKERKGRTAKNIDCSTSAQKCTYPANTIFSLFIHAENPLQRDFLRLCLLPAPKSRATAKELLAHPALLEGATNPLVVLAATAALEAGKNAKADKRTVADYSEFAQRLEVGSVERALPVLGA